MCIRVFTTNIVNKCENVCHIFGKMSEKSRRLATFIDIESIRQSYSIANFERVNE